MVSTFQWVLVGFAGFVVLAPIIVSSLTLCAPKWWREKVAPRVPESVKGITAALTPKQPPRWMGVLGLVVVGLVYGPMLLTLAFIIVFVSYVIAAGFYYVGVCMALIERKCPYGPKQAEKGTDAMATAAGIVRWARGVPVWLQGEMEKGVRGTLHPTPSDSTPDP